MVSVVESAMEEIPLQEEESSMEYRVLMAYAQRTLPASKYAQLTKPATPQVENVAAATSGEESKAASNGECPHKERKKKSRRLPKKLIPKCLRPPDQAKVQRCEQKDGRSPEERRARSIARGVQGIIRKIKEQEQESGFRMLRRVYSVETDGDDEDELIASLVQILRSAGDELNDQMTQDQSLLERVQSLWSYSFFTKVADLFLSDRVAGSESEEERQTNRIALCVHATTALTALDNQPMNRVLGFGARYLRENYAPWIQSRGGLEAVMRTQDDEEVE